MSKTIILFAATAAALMTSAAFAADMKPLSPSIVDISALPENGYDSVSIVAYGEPPAPKVEEKRRFEVGFVPTVPPAPNAGNADGVKAAMTIETGSEPAKAAMNADNAGEMKEAVSDEKTSSVDAPATQRVEVEVNVDNMHLRTE